MDAEGKFSAKCSGSLVKLMIKSKGPLALESVQWMACLLGFGQKSFHVAECCKAEFDEDSKCLEVLGESCFVNTMHSEN